MKVLELGPKHVREICCLLNGKDCSYCLNVDGEGGRCAWWFRRPKHEKQRIRLVKPDCRHNPLYILRVLKELEREGLVLRTIEYREDPYSRWGKDRYVIYHLKRP